MNCINFNGTNITIGNFDKSENPAKVSGDILTRCFEFNEDEIKELVKTKKIFIHQQVFKKEHYQSIQPSLNDTFI